MDQSVDLNRRADDLKTKRKAESHHLTVLGLLGVLDLAADSGLLDLGAAMEHLRATSYHIAPELLNAMLAKASRRTSS